MEKQQHCKPNNDQYEKKIRSVINFNSETIENLKNEVKYLKNKIYAIENKHSQQLKLHQQELEIKNKEIKIVKDQAILAEKKHRKHSQTVKNTNDQIFEDNQEEI